MNIKLISKHYSKILNKTKIKNKLLKMIIKEEEQLNNEDDTNEGLEDETEQKSLNTKNQTIK